MKARYVFAAFLPLHVGHNQHFQTSQIDCIVVCIRCAHYGIRHEAYFLVSRKRWSCKHCERNFYIATNTAFAPEEISQNYFKCLEEQMKYDEMPLVA